MKAFVGCILALAIAATACAQTKVTRGSKLAWDYNGVALSDAQSWGENYYVDSAITGIPFTSKSCVLSGALVTCTSSLPILTAGVHSLAITSTFQGDESVKSLPLSVSYVVLVTPTNLRPTAKLQQIIIPADLHSIASYRYDSHH